MHEKCIVNYHSTHRRLACDQKAPIFPGHFPVHPVFTLREDQPSPRASSHQCRLLAPSKWMLLCVHTLVPQKCYRLSPASPAIPLTHSITTGDVIRDPGEGRALTNVSSRLPSRATLGENMQKADERQNQPGHQRMTARPHSHSVRATSKHSEPAALALQPPRRSLPWCSPQKTPESLATRQLRLQVRVGKDGDGQAQSGPGKTESGLMVRASRGSPAAPPRGSTSPVRGARAREEAEAAAAPQSPPVPGRGARRWQRTCGLLASMGDLDIGGVGTGAARTRPGRNPTPADRRSSRRAAAENQEGGGNLSQGGPTK